MATQDAQINHIVEKSIEDSLKLFKDENTESIGKDTRTTAAIEMNEILEKQKPFFANLLGFMIRSNNEIMMSNMESMLRRIIDEKDAERHTEIQKIRSDTSDKTLDLVLKIDKLETQNRQDNIILFGHEEPVGNYSAYGRESVEELENILINAAEKVSVQLNPDHISEAFRMGKPPRGPPKFTSSGTKVARPIMYKLIKRSKKTELLRAKKNLKTDHNIKIAEDTTQIRKSLCDFINNMGTVKVAYPVEGKICVRLNNNPEKVTRIESVKDLSSIGFTGEFDWDELGLAECKI